MEEDDDNGKDRARNRPNRSNIGKVGLRTRTKNFFRSGFNMKMTGLNNQFYNPNNFLLIGQKPLVDDSRSRGHCQTAYWSEPAISIQAFAKAGGNSQTGACSGYLRWEGILLKTKTLLLEMEIIVNVAEMQDNIGEILLNQINIQLMCRKSWGCFLGEQHIDSCVLVFLLFNFRLVVRNLSIKEKLFNHQLSKI